MKLLFDHVSPETAYVVEDYPYGFRLRCKIRYWLEFKPKVGFRLVSQTSNPKRPSLVWNKPKASTYAKFGGAMYLDEANHVQWMALGEYSSGAEAKSWQEIYGAAVPEAGRPTLNQWVATKLAYDAARKPGDPLETGLFEAHKAFLNEALKTIKTGTPS